MEIIKIIIALVCFFISGFLGGAWYKEYVQKKRIGRRMEINLTTPPLIDCLITI